MRNNNNQTIVLYALSVIGSLAVFASAQSFGFAHGLLAVYAPLSFFTLAAADFFRTCQNPAGEVAAYASTGTARPPIYLDQYGVLQVARLGISPPAPVSDNVRPGTCFADRCLLYVLTAPLILPARLYQLVAQTK